MHHQVFVDRGFDVYVRSPKDFYMRRSTFGSY
uniref:Uncharacterized protein n=1 Tax=Arundo donax TaxID=35708 RepID=A0A0A9HSP1_ARUDO